MKSINRQIYYLVFLAVMLFTIMGCHKDNIKGGPLNSVVVPHPCLHSWHNMMDYFSANCARWQRVIPDEKLPVPLKKIIDKREDTIIFNLLMETIKITEKDGEFKYYPPDVYQERILSHIAYKLSMHVPGRVRKDKQKFTHLGVIEVWNGRTLISRRQLQFHARLYCCDSLSPNASNRERDNMRKYKPRECPGCHKSPISYDIKDEKLIYEQIPGSDFVAVSKYVETQWTGGAWWRMVFFPASDDCLHKDSK